MEGLAIATASFSLAGLCMKLYTFVSNIQTVDKAITTLGEEINLLSHVLHSVHDSFKDPLRGGTAPAVRTGHETQLWANVKRSLDDCEKTLKRLKRILESVHEGGFLKKQFKMDWRSGEISLLKDQVISYRQTMQLSLELVTV